MLIVYHWKFLSLGNFLETTFKDSNLINLLRPRWDESTINLEDTCFLMRGIKDHIYGTVFHGYWLITEVNHMSWTCGGFVSWNPSSAFQLVAETVPSFTGKECGECSTNKWFFITQKPQNVGLYSTSRSLWAMSRSRLGELSTKTRKSRSHNP